MHTFADTLRQEGQLQALLCLEVTDEPANLAEPRPTLGALSFADRIWIREDGIVGSWMCRWQRFR